MLMEHKFGKGFIPRPYPLRRLKEDSRRDETVLHLSLKEYIPDKDFYEGDDNKIHAGFDDDYDNLKVDIDALFVDKVKLIPYLSQQ